LQIGYTEPCWNTVGERRIRVYRYYQTAVGYHFKDRSFQETLMILVEVLCSVACFLVHVVGFRASEGKPTSVLFLVFL